MNVRPFIALLDARVFCCRVAALPAVLTPSSFLLPCFSMFPYGMFCLVKLHDENQCVRRNIGSANIPGSTTIDHFYIIAIDVELL